MDYTYRFFSYSSDGLSHFDLNSRSPVSSCEPRNFFKSSIRFNFLLVNLSPFAFSSLLMYKTFCVSLVDDAWTSESLAATGFDELASWRLFSLYFFCFFSFFCFLILSSLELLLLLLLLSLSDSEVTSFFLALPFFVFLVFLRWRFFCGASFVSSLELNRKTNRLRYNYPKNFVVAYLVVSSLEVYSLSSDWWPFFLDLDMFFFLLLISCYLRPWRSKTLKLYVCCQTIWLQTYKRNKWEKDAWTHKSKMEKRLYIDIIANKSSFVFFVNIICTDLFANLIWNNLIANDNDKQNTYDFVSIK